MGLLRVVPVSSGIARLGGLYKRDYGKSHGVGPADAIVAATATMEDAELMTLNVKHYPMFSGIEAAYRKQPGSRDPSTSTRTVGKLSGGSAHSRPRDPSAHDFRAGGTRLARLPPRRVVAPPGDAAKSATLQLDYVGGIRNAGKVISALHRGESGSCSATAGPASKPSRISRGFALSEVRDVNSAPAPLQVFRDEAAMAMLGRVLAAEQAAVGDCFPGDRLLDASNAHQIQEA